MHRFFLPPGARQGDELELRDSQAHQICDVLRLRPGEVVGAFDGSGVEYQAELVEVTRGLVRGRILEASSDSREPRTELVLYQGLLKGDKFEWVLQKGTEVGIAAFVPMATARVVSSSVSRGKRARWERILIEAAEQSGRTRVPRLAEVQPFARAVEAAQLGQGCAVIPWEEERATGLKDAVCAAGPVHLFIGPEGGFSREEIEVAQSHGLRPVTLGPLILRAETAGLVAASAIIFSRGDLGGSRSIEVA
ncbi:MAG: 16S rRNA (uracil(1498)-N(3))-methyltransferase [Rudaea sp.]